MCKLMKFRIYWGTNIYLLFSMLLLQSVFKWEQRTKDLCFGVVHCWDLGFFITFLKCSSNVCASCAQEQVNCIIKDEKYPTFDYNKRKRNNRLRNSPFHTPEHKHTQTAVKNLVSPCKWVPHELCRMASWMNVCICFTYALCWNIIKKKAPHYMN